MHTLYTPIPSGEKALILVTFSRTSSNHESNRSHAPQNIAAATQLLTSAIFEIWIIYRWKYISGEGGSVWGVKLAMLTHFKHLTATTDAGNHGGPHVEYGGDVISTADRDDLRHSRTTCRRNMPTQCRACSIGPIRDSTWES